MTNLAKYKALLAAKAAWEAANPNWRANDQVWPITEWWEENPEYRIAPRVPTLADDVESVANAVAAMVLPIAYSVIFVAVLSWSAHYLGLF